MKKNFFLIAFLTPFILFGQNFGIGVVIGSPTGLSGKYLLGYRAAIAANAGWSFIDNEGLHLTCDYQYLFPTVIKTEEGKEIKNLTPYVAIGGRFLFKEKEPGNETEFHLGLRIGGGIEYVIARFGIFLEILPVVDLIPKTDFDIEGGLGLRFYL